MSSVYPKKNKKLFLRECFEAADSVAAEHEAAADVLFFAALFPEAQDDVDMIVAVRLQRMHGFAVRIIDDAFRIVHFVEPVQDVDAVDVHNAADVEFPENVFAGVSEELEFFAVDDDVFVQ